MRWLFIVWVLGACADPYFPPYPDVTPVDGPDVTEARAIVGDILGDPEGKLLEVEVTWVAEDCIPSDWSGECYRGGMWSVAWGIFIPHRGLPLHRTALAHEFLHVLIVDAGHTSPRWRDDIPIANQALKAWADTTHQTKGQDHGNEPNTSANQRGQARDDRDVATTAHSLRCSIQSVQGRDDHERY